MTVMRVLLALTLLATAGCTGQPSAPTSSTAPSTTAPAPSTTTPPASTVTTSAPVASPSSTGNLAGFLAALRTGGVPVSESGQPEALIGQGVCEQIRAGSSPDKVAYDLRATGYTMAQAATLVAAAQENFCG